MRTPPAANVLVTGASSGIGAAIAVECARRGARRLFLCGRDASRLAGVARRCREAGARADDRVVDVTDAVAVGAWIRECDEAAPLELVFANAGVAAGAVDDAPSTRRVFAVNVGGCLNTALPAIERFRLRASGRRQLVITASIAGYAPLSACPAYAASKAAVRSWALGLRGMLRAEGIRVNAVCPGFVRSRITDANTCPMPFFMEADRAARVILDRVDRDTGLIAFPWPMRFASWLFGAIPWRLAELVGRALPAKDGGRPRGR